MASHAPQVTTTVISSLALCLFVLPPNSKTVQHFSIYATHASQTTFRKKWNAAFEHTHFNPINLRLHLHMKKRRMCWLRGWVGPK